MHFEISFSAIYDNSEIGLNSDRNSQEKTLPSSMKSSFECKKEILNYLQQNKPRLNIHFS